MNTGKVLIIAERRRQSEVEGWTSAHDDQHGPEVLENAALSYRDAEGPGTTIPSQWPWADECWKPKTRKRNLERSGALYLAAAESAERVNDYRARDRLLDHAHSCAILLDSLID